MGHSILLWARPGPPGRRPTQHLIGLLRQIQYFLPNLAIFAQRLEKVKLAAFTLVGRHCPLPSRGFQMTLRFDVEDEAEKVALSSNISRAVGVASAGRYALLPQ
jgi:hypothetical protein